MDAPLLLTAPIDPIFAVAEEAKSAGSGVINASIGVILDEEGHLLVFPSTKKAAEEWLKRANGNFSYPPLLGVADFLQAATMLACGTTEHVVSSAAVGGTGALSLNLKLAKRLGYNTALVPTPAWPNYARLLEGHTIAMAEVSFVKDNKPSTIPVIDAIRTTKEPTIVLLQTGCHNPTGKEWSSSQWEEVASALEGSRHIALLDCAYQGLGNGIEQDSEPVRLFLKRGLSFLLAWSPSKNHAIYGLRTGLACASLKGASSENVQAWYRILSRELHSAAPAPGQHIVTLVQEKYRNEWENDVHALRGALKKKRTMLQEAFPNWREKIEGNGLFTVLPLSMHQVRKLKSKKIFLTEDGRVNIAGIPLKRMEEFVTGIQSVL